MLDAACPGEVFTSPTPDQMLDATKAVNGGAGVLHIVKNYTGDVMNFEMAADLGRRRRHRGRGVVIDDDVAVQDSLYTAGGAAWARRCWRKRSAGPPPEEKRPLAEVAELCRKVNANGRSMGMALTSCIVPPPASRPSSSATTRWRSASASTASRAASGEARPAAEIVERSRRPIVEDLPFEMGDEVLAFVNGMGGTPLIELYVVYNDLQSSSASAGSRSRAT
jgi:dihydroxyacetone kinase-like protein